MCKALDDLYNDGIECGMKRGLEQGAQKGAEKNENMYDALIKALANSGRIQEIVRCTSDKEYKKKLLSEFNLS